tara:strand:- start:258 stop:1163 length:906 start_codon:yes stop_codon:yes gene_type:complete
MLMAKSMTLFFGIGSVFVGWQIAKKLWGSEIANKVGWIIAFFPSLILYSVLVMREAYICFFLLVAVYGVIKWSRKENFSSIFLAMVGFIGATFFHGASVVGAMTFITIVGGISFLQLFKSLINFKISLKLSLVLVSFLVILVLYLSNKIYIPYIKDFQFISDTDVLLRKTRLSVMGHASYPEWTIARNPFELIYKIPARSIYFLFSPFPWDVRAFKHLIGMFDAFLYIYLVFLIWCNRKVIWEDRALRIILLILLTYIVVFAVGVGNFGTGIRHRSKFAIMFVLLAAPLIKKLIFFKKSHK